MEEELLERLHTERLTDIVEDEHIVGYNTVMKHVNEDPEFAAKFRAALAANGLIWLETSGRETEAIDPKHALAEETAARRAKAELALKLAGKYNPSWFGARSTLVTEDEGVSQPLSYVVLPPKDLPADAADPSDDE